MSNTSTKEQFQLYRSRFDLVHANKRLLWNPNPLNQEARREALWERRSKSPSCRRMTTIELLNLAMKRAKYFAEHLATYHEGQLILVVENLDGWKRKDSKYWTQRSNFYKAKGERLDNEKYNRKSKSIMSKKRPIDVCEATELLKARARARNAAGGLAVLPASKAFLDVDPNY